MAGLFLLSVVSLARTLRKFCSASDIFVLYYCRSLQVGANHIFCFHFSFTLLCIAASAPEIRQEIPSQVRCR